MALGRIWLKLYVGWHESDWLSVLSPESRLCWILLLERVKTHGDAGSLKKSNYDDLARRWNLGVEHIRTMVKAAVIDGALDEDESHWHVTGWGEYQEDRTNAERQKRYRERKKCNETDSGNGALRNDRNVTGRGEENRLDNLPIVPPKGRTVFVPPTVPECCQYAAEIGIAESEGEHFHDYWTSAGWKRKSGTMADWRASLRTWKSNLASRSNVKPGSAAPKRSAEDARRLVNGGD